MTVAERPLTQKQRALQLLRSHPTGVCIADVGEVYPYDVLTFRNRVGELIRDGFPIVVRRCTFHQHRSGIVRYSLTGYVEQLEMPE